MKTGTSSIQENTKAAIIALEKQALELWNNGNPDGIYRAIGRRCRLFKSYIPTGLLF